MDYQNGLFGVFNLSVSGDFGYGFQQQWFGVDGLQILQSSFDAAVGRLLGSDSQIL